MSDFLRNRDRDLYASEIPWSLTPVVPSGTTTMHASTPDAAGLVCADVVALEMHVASLEADARMYREMLRTTLDALNTARDTIVRQSARLLEQAEQLRMVRRS